VNQACTTMAVAALILGATFVAHVRAQSSGGQYDIDPFVIAGGGGSIAAGHYQISSTLGQAAGTTLAGGSYVVFNGYWSPIGGVSGDFVFANGFE
jgi:hypothetical protein